MHGKYVLTWTQFPGCNVAIIGMPSVIAGMLANMIWYINIAIFVHWWVQLPTTNHRGKKIDQHWWTQQDSSNLGGQSRGRTSIGGKFNGDI
jgi:hypothetical protein